MIQIRKLAPTSNKDWWDTQGQSETTWDGLGRSETAWDSLGTCGTTWVDQGRSVVTRDYLGPVSTWEDQGRRGTTDIFPQYFDFDTNALLEKPVLRVRNRCI